MIPASELFLCALDVTFGHIRNREQSPLPPPLFFAGQVRRIDRGEGGPQLLRDVSGGVR